MVKHIKQAALLLSISLLSILSIPAHAQTRSMEILKVEKFFLVFILKNGPSFGFGFIVEA